MKKEPYTTPCSTSNPGLIVIIGDSSHSMIGEKNEVLNDSFNYFVNELIFTNGNGRKIKDNLYLCFIEYGGDGGDTAKILRQGFLSEFANNPIGFKQINSSIINGDLFPDGNEQTMPVFVNYQAKGATATSNAFSIAADVITRFVTIHPDSPAPKVIHITDGHPWSNQYKFEEVNRTNEAASKLTSIGTTDGNTILFNLHIIGENDDKKEPQYFFPEKGTEILGYGNRILESLSVVIPPIYVANAKRFGMTLGENPMSFATNVDAKHILKFIMFGSSSMTDRMS